MVSGCSLFIFLLLLQKEIYCDPRTVPRATKSSELHILHYSSFANLELLYQHIVGKVQEYTHWKVQSIEKYHTLDRDNDCLAIHMAHAG